MTDFGQKFVFASADLMKRARILPEIGKKMEKYGRIAPIEIEEEKIQKSQKKQKIIERFKKKESIKLNSKNS